MTLRAPPKKAYVFERQRLSHAEPIAGGSRRALAENAARRFLPRIGIGSSWRLHAFCADPSGASPSEKRISAVGKTFLAIMESDYPDLTRGYRAAGEAIRDPGAWAVQLALLDIGLWGSVTPLRALSHPYPGGVHRMRRIPEAPSRSYMKIEEAFVLFGETPRARQRVIDLGAAPGGWSFAFLQRGCRVVAVDRGPLKLKRADDLAGRLVHVKEDGLRYRPPEAWVPVDWLVSDMLIPPGMTLGLLRKWAERGWMRRFIINIKIPQREPYSALRPLERLLSAITGGMGEMRQLYHDRREVTAWGNIAGPGRPAREPGGAGYHEPSRFRARCGEARR